MKHLAYLNKYFWKYRGRLLAGFLLIVAGDIFSVYAPVVVRDGIDFLTEALSASGIHAEQSIIQPKSFRNIASWFGHELSPVVIRTDNLKEVVVKTGLMLGGLYLVMFLLKGIFLFYQRQALIVMSRHIEYDLKNEIYDKYQQLDHSFYKRNRTGDLMNRISEDVNRVRMYTGPAVMYTLNLSVLLVLCVIVMLGIDAELTLYTLSPLPFMMIAIFYISTLINKRTDHVQSQQSKLSAMVQETMSGIRVLKSFHREKHYENSFDQESTEYKKRQLKLVTTDALFMPVLVLLVGLSTILTIYIGAQKVMAGEITPGVIVQFVFYVNILTWPFAIVGWVTSLVQKAEASQARINEFLAIKPSIADPKIVKKVVAGDVEFRHVTYTYEDSGTVALSDLSFRVQKGMTLGIIGRTGGGKSTIASLLPRLIDPTTGSIAVNDVDLRDCSLQQLRGMIGYVPQEVFLFSDTIRNNIAFGNDQLKDEQVMQAAKDADIHDSIISLPEGYNTLLGERGINLSGGQKQRISIARALANDPDILILDDCLSAVDTETEDRILRALKRIMKNKTCIIIAHRISSIRESDEIIYLDHGQISEKGTHNELLAKDGKYASLFKKQQLEHSSEQ